MVAQTVKKSPAMQETWVQSLHEEDPLEKGMAATPVFLPKESHGQRSWADYSPWAPTESDTTERLTPSPSSLCHPNKKVFCVHRRALGRGHCSGFCRSPPQQTQLSLREKPQHPSERRVFFL
ncbi:unnamed protein product [Rangifer tarandus platyrhynchus]|uniref:Uncharacterized protein n=2 Tax=Rangifer tarandus platyrhynchus TaxID=3082113 RepID=A0ACB1MN67_RANTA|nr:unnamed protein product [Rangifer tarandus platyrhynchus]